MPPLDPQRLLGLAIPDRQVACDPRDFMLYALAVGMGPDPADLPFVYEKGLRALPSIATMLTYDDSWIAPGGLDLATIVHGALDLRFRGALPVSGEVRVTSRICSLTDKGEGRGGLVNQVSEIHGPSGLLCVALSTLFARGAGGFGGSIGEQPSPPPLGDGPPADQVTVETALNQAQIFRLLGDRNPLHVDPAVAQAVGFDRPILHGAASFGIACQTVLRRFCALDPARMTRFAARFAGPVYPGEALTFEFWPKPGAVAFRAVTARATVALDQGYAEWS